MKSSEEDRLHWLLAFIQAENLLDSRLIVEAHPELLDTIIDDTLTRLAQDQQWEALRYVVLWRRDLLRLCREAGIAVAYAKYTDQDYPLLPSEKDPAGQEMTDVVFAFLNARSWGERKHLVEVSPDQLLTNAADQFLFALISQYKEDTEAVNLIKKCKVLLLRCRSEGIDAAFADCLRLELLLEALGQSQNPQRDLELAQEAITLVDREYEPLQWANLHLFLAKYLIEQPSSENATNIEQAINHLHQALEVFTREAFPKSWAQASSNLSAAYLGRMYGDPTKNIELAISYGRAALEIYTSQDYPEESAGTEFNVGLAYINLATGDLGENQEQAIVHCQRALEFYTFEHSPQMWARVHLGLADACRISVEYRHAGGRERITEAFAHYQQALRVYTRENYPESWANIQLKLANTTLYEEDFGYESAMKRMDSYEQSINYALLALQVYTREDFPEKWAMVQQQLGLAYSNLDRGARTENLKQSISHYQLALQVYTRDYSPEEWARIHHNLAKAYYDYSGGNRAENLEQAIACGQRALEVRTKEAFPDKWALTHDILGLSYTERIYGEQADNLEQAIAHFQMALQIYTRDRFPRDWARVQNNLGGAYAKGGRKLVVENGNVFDRLEKAIQHFEWALEVRTQQDYPFNWAQTQYNLANTYRGLTRGDRNKNLEQAIAHYELALEVWTQQNDSFYWAIARRSLALTYKDLQTGKRSENLEKAITNLHLAAEVITQEAFPYFWAMINRDFGESYAELSQEGTEHLDQAIAHYQKALDIFSQTTFPADRRSTLNELGDLYFRQRRWIDAYAAYESAIEAGETLVAVAYTETGQKDEISKVSRLYTHATYCLIEQGELAKAFLLLQQGKARLLARAMVLSEVDLTALPENQRLILFEVRRTLGELEAEQRLSPGMPNRRTDAELGALLQQVYLKLNQIIQEVQLDNPHFMYTGLDLSESLTLIPPGGALVVPVVTSQGGSVFILPHGLETITLEHILPLQTLDNTNLWRVLVGTREEPGWALTYADWETNKITLQEWMSALDTFTSTLWEILMGPIHDRLVRLGVEKGALITILPSSGLGLLPLHAAWRMVEGTKRALLDEYTVSYAPSTYVLSTSLRRRQNGSQREHTLLALINPTGDLLYTSVEGRMIATYFAETARKVLAGNEVSKQAVVQNLGETTYVHFSCHGYCDWSDFMHSRLLLAYGEPLTLSDIISPQCDLSAARLVTLSACETGQSDFANFPDEYIGLASAFLQAGASAVVSSLWAVDDLSTALLIQEMYRRHLVEGQDIAEALRGAQLWLQQATVGELQLAEYWKQIYEASERTDSSAFLAMRYYRTHSEERPFANPYYWAAFTLTGA